MAPAVERSRRNLGLAMDLDSFVRHVDEPALGDSSARVEAEFVLALGAIRRLCDLDNEHGTRRVSITVCVGMPRHDRYVRLGLRGVVEGERKLWVDLPDIVKRSPEGVQHLTDSRSVAASLRLTNDERAVEQLEPLVGREHAEIDQALRFDAWPLAPTRLGRRRPL